MTSSYLDRRLPPARARQSPRTRPRNPRYSRGNPGPSRTPARRESSWSSPDPARQRPGDGGNGEPPGPLALGIFRRPTGRSNTARGTTSPGVMLGPRNRGGSTSRAPASPGSSCATPSGLRPGSAVEYRVREGHETRRLAAVRRCKGGDQPYRFRRAFRDCGANTKGQKAVAYQTYLLFLDFVFIACDIVYSRGLVLRVSREVLADLQCLRGFPDGEGALLLRSTSVHRWRRGITNSGSSTSRCIPTGSPTSTTGCSP